MNGLDIQTIALSSIISGVVALCIAWFFRFRLKPKFEIIFDDNRQANLRIIFSGLHLFDMEFASFYKIFERDIVELTKDNEEIIPRPKFKSPEELELEKDEDIIDLGTMMRMDKKFQEVKQVLTPILTRMREHHNIFLKDYHIFLNYLHDSFLRDITNYYFTTTYYVEWVLKGENYYSIGIDRKKYAKRIIDYLEKDSGINTKEESISRFISKWKKEF